MSKSEAPDTFDFNVVCEPCSAVVPPGPGTGDKTNTPDSCAGGPTANIEGRKKGAAHDPKGGAQYGTCYACDCGTSKGRLECEEHFKSKACIQRSSFKNVGPDGADTAESIAFKTIFGWNPLGPNGEPPGCS